MFKLPPRASVLAGAAALLALTGHAAAAATLTRSIDVKGTPAQVWARIGGFCAIKDWHPAIASCRTDGRSPPTRTLTTRDGATFVELETGRSESARFYGYTFKQSPLPVREYRATISVEAKGRGMSTVTWSGAWSPLPGQAEAAEQALAGIYESGLAAIKAQHG